MRSERDEQRAARRATRAARARVARLAAARARRTSGARRHRGVRGGAGVGEQRFGIGRGGGVDLEHVDDDDGDVVLAAGRVRGVDEQLGRALRIGLAARDALDVALAHHRGEPVGAEHDAVAGRDVERVEVDVDVGVDAERARDDRALRMRLGLLGREPALADELLDEAVVVGDPAQRAVVQQVRARVADVTDRAAGGRRRRRPRSASCPCR